MSSAFDYFGIILLINLIHYIDIVICNIKPILIERGKDVRTRRRDLAAINKEHFVNPESNYCFGEGGAGTYSDGKLYTRSKKRGDVTRILELFVAYGASPDILVDAHPHIGTNKLPHIIEKIRETIISCGGEIHFNSKLTDIEIEGDIIKRITINQLTTINYSSNSKILIVSASICIVLSDKFKVFSFMISLALVNLLSISLYLLN